MCIFNPLQFVSKFFSFLKLVAGIDETLKSELGLDAEITSNIQQIAKRLYDNVSIFCISGQFAL